MRDSMLFYRSFYDAVRDLDAENFKKAVCALLNYGLDEISPNTTGIEKTIFILAKPQIDKNNVRYQNALKGGRNKSEPNSNQNDTKHKPNDNQTHTKCVPNVNDKVNANGNVNDADTDIGSFCDTNFCNSDNIAISFVLEDGTMYGISQEEAKRYQEFYPDIDVMQELRAIASWCESNPGKRKIRAKAKKFVNNWLNREQKSVKDQRNHTIIGHIAERPRNAFHNFEQRNYSEEFYKKLECQLDDRIKV